jgi:hypothetical protein
VIADVLEVMHRWLNIPDENEVLILIAAAIASQFPGDPVWMFLVGASGSAKTEILRSLSASDRIYTLDDVTEKAFISGFGKNEGQYDLLPQLDGKLLVIKDFSPLLQTSTQKEKDRVFSILRSAYDGYYESRTGTMKKKRSYQARFGLLAGVTQVIDYYSKVHALLGERFIKLRTRYDRHDAVKAAFQHSGREARMREEISEVVRIALDYYSSLIVHKPALSSATAHKIEYLADCLAVLRSPIPRDYRREVSYLLDAEVATRVGKQLLRLAECLSRMKSWDYKHLVRVAEDSIFPERLKLMRYLLKVDEATLTEISQEIKLPRHLVRITAEDLWLLDTCERRVENDTYYYKIKDDFAQAMEIAELGKEIV